MKFILSVIGSNWETLSKAEIPSDVFKKIKIKTLLTALLRKDFKEAAYESIVLIQTGYADCLAKGSSPGDRKG